MKSRMIVQSLGLAAVMAISAGAFAGTYNDGPRKGFPVYNNGPFFNNQPVFQESLRLVNDINKRQDEQTNRILDGMYKKRIDPIEFRKLMDGQREIQRLERSFLADGVLTGFEYQKLDALLDVASRQIFKEAHDAQGRPGSASYGWNSSYGGYNPRNR